MKKHAGNATETINSSMKIVSKKSITLYLKDKSQKRKSDNKKAKGENNECPENSTFMPGGTGLGNSILRK
jgi:hypothetical protein